MNLVKDSRTSVLHLLREGASIDDITRETFRPACTSRPIAGIERPHPEETEPTCKRCLALLAGRP